MGKKVTIIEYVKAQEAFICHHEIKSVNHEYPSGEAIVITKFVCKDGNEATESTVILKGVLVHYWNDSTIDNPIYYVGY